MTPFLCLKILSLFFKNNRLSIRFYEIVKQLRKYRVLAKTDLKSKIKSIDFIDIIHFANFVCISLREGQRPTSLQYYLITVNINEKM